MSKVHIAKQGFVTKSAIPTVSRTITATVYPSILLLGSGSNGSTTFTDSSVFNNTMSVFGNSQISTAQFPTGMTSSMLFDGNGDYLTTSNSRFAVTNQNFTLEAYIYATANVTNTRQVLGCWGTASADVSYSMGIANNNVGYFEFNTALSGGYGVITTATNIFTINSWVHLAVVRNGSSIVLYVNGTSRGSTTTSGTLITNSTNTLSIAGNVLYNQYWNGYISNARITVGAALYTSNFTPPSLPLANNISTSVTVSNNTYGVNQNY